MGRAPGMLCICEICTCGRHRCVHHPVLGNSEKGKCVLTEYKDTYKRHTTTPARILNPHDANKIEAGEFDPSTSYKRTYVKHEIQPKLRHDTIHKHTVSPGKFDGTSSYRHDYTEKYPSKAPSARPMPRAGSAPGPFNGSTVHRETYRPWKVEVKQGIRQPPALRLPKGKFTHSSTFQEDFKAHQLVPRETVRIPEPSLAISPGKFSNSTTMRQDYTPKSATPRKSFKRREEALRHKDPFDHKSTCQTSFIGHTGRPATSLRPPNMTKLSTGKLDCDTTHNLTYKAWGVPKVVAGKPRTVWVEPSEPFNHKTTVQQDFDRKRMEPAKSARPDYCRTHPGEFDGSTTHREQFKRWDVKQQHSYRPAVQHVTPGKFEGETTFQADFKPVSAIPRTPVVVRDCALEFSGDQEFRTQYNDTYRGEPGSRPIPCPARSLVVELGSPSATGHIYTGDHNGHQYFSSDSQIVNDENQLTS